MVGPVGTTRTIPLTALLTQPGQSEANCVQQAGMLWWSSDFADTKFHGRMACNCFERGQDPWTSRHQANLLFDNRTKKHGRDAHPRATAPKTDKCVHRSRCSLERHDGFGAKIDGPGQHQAFLAKFRFVGVRSIDTFAAATAFLKLPKRNSAVAS